MDVTSYLLGKKAGGGTPINNQNKDVTITENGSTTVSADASYTGLGTVGITTNVQPDLESKSVTITENGTTTVTPTTGKDGLSEVEVTTNVSGGTTPTKGFVVNNWNNDGYLTDITTYGYTNVPNYMFARGSETSAFSKLENITFNSEITSIGNYSFQNQSSLAITTLPNNIVSLGKQTFAYCTSLKKMSMNNVTAMGSNIANNSAFRGCTGLKKVWIGSAITNSGMQQNAFVDCTNLEAIYIDLPRATVESFGGYQYAFMDNTSKVGIIICNDDVDFIDKETFDALVVS